MQILSDQQETLLRGERKVLNDLRLALVQFGAPAADTKTLGESIEQLDELFLLVVVGEFNSGKSAFINALLGQKLLLEGVTPTTSQINVLRYGPAESRTVVNEHLHVISLPAPLLAEISIVDTPGTNAVIREHEILTAGFVPRADLVLFITSSDRPFTESERQFLVQVRDWGKKVVMVINKADILQSEEDRREVRTYVAENGRQLLGITPDVFLVSARQAQQAKLGQPQFWEASGFEALEAYIHDRLNESGRLRLKLLSPLGTGSHLTEKYLGVIESRLGLLGKDFQMLSNVDSQLAVFSEDLKRDFQFRLADIENPLYELEQRGDAFFEEAFRLGRIFDLLRKEKIQQDFEHQVVADIPARIEQKANEIIDWILESQMQQWQSVTGYIADRRREHQEHLIGEAGSFNYDRQRLMDAVGREARKVVDNFDRQAEARLIAEDAQEMVAASLVIEAGAIGLGALVTVLATTAAGDVTGILSASVIAALGLFIIPARRKAAKIALSEKIGGIRSRLVESLTTAFDRELVHSQEQIREAIGPYSRFVRAESGKLEDARGQFVSFKTELDRLKGAVEVE
jgi:small GTP-binding protein